MNIDIEAINKAIEDYASQAEEEDKYSVTGLCIALAITREVLELWRAGYVCREDEEDRRVVPNVELAECVARGELYIHRYWEESDKATKFLAGLTEIAAFFVVYIAAVLAILSAVNKTGVDFGTVLLLSAAMALGQLMMMGVGMLLGTFIIRARSVMSAAMGVVLLLYVLSMFVNMQPDLSWLKYFTPRSSTSTRVKSYRAAQSN